MSSENLPTVVYSSESPLRHPVKLVREIFADIWRSRELTMILFTRDLKAQYRQSVLGYVWIFIPILGTTLIWMFLNSSKVIQVAETPIPYPAFVLVGTMIWTVFTASLNQPLASFNAGKSVFMKLKVPPEAFIMAGLSKIVFDTTLRLLVLIPVFFILKIVPPWTAILFPIGLLCTMLIGVSIGLLILPLGSLYTDVARIVGMAVGFGMYLTPVVYPPPRGGWAGMLIDWNPMTAVVITVRDWLTLGNSQYCEVMVVVSLLAAFALLIAIIIFRVVLPRLVERMGM